MPDMPMPNHLRNHRHWKQNITSRLAFMMFCIIGLSAFTLFVAITFYVSSINDAEAINVAGSLRMQSYRLAYAMHSTPEFIVQYQHSLSDSFTVLGELIDVVSPNHITYHYEAIHAQWQALTSVVEQQQYDVYSDYLPLFVDQINAFVFQLQRNSTHKLHILAIVGGSALVCIFMLVLMTLRFSKQQIVAPLHQLIAASQTMAAGDFTTQIQFSTRNELADLAKAMNGMAASLALSYHELEHTIEEKTRRLAHSNHSLTLLYQCSGIMAKHPIQKHHFKGVIDKLLALEGITALRLHINTPESWSITKGEPNHSRWHNEEIIADGRKLGELSWQFQLPCPDQDQIAHACLLLGRSILITENQHQTQQLLVMEERNHLARELHDSIAQSLSYLKIQVTMLKRQIPQDSEALLELDTELNNAYGQLRELLNTFRLSLSDTPFSVALNNLMTPYKKQGKITIDNHLPDSMISPTQQPHLLNIIREAVANATHHANADHIAVLLKHHGDRLTAEIIDDGIGFDPLTPVDKHYGVNIMRERAALIDGVIDIDSTISVGTTVRFSGILSELS